MISFENITEILKKCANIAIPMQSVNEKPGIPGWNEFVKPYKSIFWNDIWKNAGIPDNWQLADLRMFSRSKCHWVIKQIKGNADEFVKEKTSFTLRQKSLKDFWTTIKKMRGRAICSSSIIDDCCTDKDIA